MNRYILAASAAAVFAMVGTAQAATLNGTFKVTAVNVTNVDDIQSQATDAAFQAAKALAGAASDVFQYQGNLNFSTNKGPNGNSATTILEWLSSAGGFISGLDAAFGGLQQSKGNVFADPGTGTTTFYLFERLANLGRADVTVTHDDGIAVYDDGAYLGGLVGPTAVKTTEVDGFTGGAFSILYVAANSDPSILNVDVAPVPLPAAFPLLAVGLAGLGAMRLRRRVA